MVKVEVHRLLHLGTARHRFGLGHPARVNANLHSAAAVAKARTLS
jgi:hypothetical protein